MTEAKPFLDNISSHVINHTNRGHIILLPEYRPDIAHMIAHHLSFGFYDYREQEMLSLGWEAADITVDELDNSLAHNSSQGPIVAFNIEALLVLKTSQERCEWFARFTQFPWPNQIILPVTIFLEDAEKSEGQICDLLCSQLPEQNLINRLAL